MNEVYAKRQGKKVSPRKKKKSRKFLFDAWVIPKKKEADQTALDIERLF